MRTIVYGEDWTKLWINPLVHKGWKKMADGATWKRRTAVTAVALVDAAVSFFVPYYGFFSAAAKLGTGLYDVMQGIHVRSIKKNLKKGEGDDLEWTDNSPYKTLL